MFLWGMKKLFSEGAARFIPDAQLKELAETMAECVFIVGDAYNERWMLDYYKRRQQGYAQELNNKLKERHDQEKESNEHA